MSKKDRKRGQAAIDAQTSQAAPEQPLPPAVQNPVPEVSAQPKTNAPDYSRRYFVIFWCVIMLAAAAAWILAINLPNVREAVIERWFMAALAAGLAVFLYIYK